MSGVCLVKSWTEGEARRSVGWNERPQVVPTKKIIKHANQQEI
jgi:hypothetical protein